MYVYLHTHTYICIRMFISVWIYYICFLLLPWLNKWTNELWKECAAMSECWFEFVLFFFFSSQFTTMGRHDTQTHTHTDTCILKNSSESMTQKRSASCCCCCRTVFFCSFKLQLGIGTSGLARLAAALSISCSGSV